MGEGEGPHTLESDLVPLERVHRPLEERRIVRSRAGNVELLELDGNVDVLEDLLDRLGDLLSNTVTGDEGDLSLMKKRMSEGRKR